MTRGFHIPGSTVGRPLNREIHLAGDILSGLAPAPWIVSSIMVMSWGHRSHIQGGPPLRKSGISPPSHAEVFIAFFHRTRPYLIFSILFYISIPDSLALPGDTPDILIPYPAGSLTAMSFLPPGRDAAVKTAFQSSCREGLIPFFLIRSRREVASVSDPLPPGEPPARIRRRVRSPLAVCITAGSCNSVRFFRLAASMPSVPFVPISRQKPSFRREIPEGGDNPVP